MHKDLVSLFPAVRQMRNLHWGLAQIIVAIAISIGLPVTAASQQLDKQREAKLIEGAKKEGRLVFWNPDAAKQVESALAKFRERDPFIATEYWRASGDEVHHKVMAEARAGVHNFDVAGTDLDRVTELKKSNLMKKYEWPNARSWPVSQRDPDGYWVTRLRSLKVIAYNTQLVASGEAPKSWEGVLEPRWKGKIQIDKDSADWVLMLWSTWGKEKTINFLKRLSNNVVLGGSQSQRLELLAAGAIPIDMAISLHRLAQYQDKGAPVDFIRADPAVLEKSTPIFIAQNATHPNAATLFADWFSALEGQQTYYEATLSPVADPRVKIRFTDAIKGLKVAVTAADMSVHAGEADKIFRDIFWK